MSWISTVIVSKGQYCSSLLSFVSTRRQMPADLQSRKALEAVAIGSHLDSRPARLSGRWVLLIRDLRNRHLGVIFNTYS